MSLCFLIVLIVFNFEQTRTVTIFGEHGIMDTMMAKPIKALGLYYPMIQFLINADTVTYPHRLIDEPLLLHKIFRMYIVI